MLGKGVQLYVKDSGTYHLLTGVTVMTPGARTVATESTTNNDNTTPVTTLLPTVYTEGKLSVVLSPWDGGNSYHTYIESLSESTAVNDFKITWPSDTMGSFEFQAVVSSFMLDVSPTSLLKAKFDLMPTGAITDDAALLLSVAETDAHAHVYVTSNVIELTATFDEIVQVTGTPRINITLTSGTVHANYVSGSNSNKLIFRYTVGGGDAAAATHVSITSPIDLNGGTIKDVAGQASTNTFTLTSSAWTVN